MLETPDNDLAIFYGCMPAIMTPIDHNGSVDLDALVTNAAALIDQGMSAVIYCGSMGDWPLLDDGDRTRGVSRLIDAGIPVVVGTGAINTTAACRLASHARDAGAAGLMIIPRLLSRGTSLSAQANHFARVLDAGGDLPSVIYNSPHYGYQTRADLYFELRRKHPNLIGFKEFGGAASLQYAAENITSDPDGGLLLVGVDTQVYYGMVHCGAVGAITGIGNCLPEAVLRLVDLSRAAAAGDAGARTLARQLDEALAVLARFDEGPDLTLYYRQLAAWCGTENLAKTVDPHDALTAAQRRYAKTQLELFRRWYAHWCQLGG